MMMPSRTGRLLLYGLLFLAGVAADPGYNNAWLGDAAPFTYSQSFTYSLSPEDVDHENSAVSEPSVVSSSLLYDEGCLVSSQAVMSEESFSSSFFRQFDSDFYQDDSEDDDDEDDDDDGHSSMLSNTSLRRSKVHAGGSFKPQSAFSDRKPPLNTRAPTFTSNSGASYALSIRGGDSSQSRGSEVMKRLVLAALVTLVFEGMIGHVLEFLKIVMQTSGSDASYAKVIQNITAEKGIFGLWDGFVPWGVIQSVSKGAVFGVSHTTALGILKPLAEKGTIPLFLALTLAGAVGGGFQGYVLSPTLLLKTRVMTNPVFREKMSVLRTTWLSLRIGADVIKSEGILTLMKGSNVFATKRVFDWASRYLFSDLFESLFVAMKKGKVLSVGEKSAASFLGGIASTCVTLPLDVLVAKTQDAKKAGVKVSALKLFRDELNEKGLKGLKDSYMSGFEARLLHVCLTTVVIKTGVPYVYDSLYGKEVQ